MANRLYRSQFLYGFEAMPVRLTLNVSFGSAGAPTLNSSNSKGIASISRTSAGLYVITLQDVYNKLLSAHMEQLSTGAQAAPIRNIVSQSVSSAKTITIQYRAVDNVTATDPASGEQLFMEINLGNSSV
jgi:hypothetical protein